MDPVNNEQGSTQVAATGTKQPEPAAGNPTTEDKFVYCHHCSVTKRDITICYQATGNPADPCLLLVSGLGTTVYNYSDEFCAKLADKGFYVIRFDNRDVGLSTHLDGLPTPQLPRMILPTWLSIGEGEPPYTLHQMALDGLNLLTRLGIHKAHLLGRSMGGMIVQCMALLQPERVLSLTVVYSHSSGPNVKSQTFGTTLSYLDSPASESREDVVAFRLRIITRDNGNYDVPTVQENAAINKDLDRCATDKEGMMRQLWAVQRSPARDEGLAALKGFPTLILHGLLDTTIPYENGVQLCQLIDGAKLVLFPRMGHYIPRELYDDIIAEVVLLRTKSENPPPRA